MEQPIVLKRVFMHIQQLKYMTSIKLIFVLMLFILLNIIKTAVFGASITNPYSYSGSIIYSFFMLLAVTLPIYMILFRLRSRTILIALYSIQQLYIFANLSYYLYFHDYLHLFQSSVLFKEGLGAAGHLAIPKNPKLLILLLDFPCFIYLVYSYKKIYMLNPILKNAKRLLLSICISFVFLLEGWNFIHNYSLVHILKDYPGSEERMVERYGTIVNNVVDAWVNRNDQKLIESLTYGKEINSSSDGIQKPNYIIIQVESMDSNIIHKNYEGKEIMPFMAALSKDCVYYPYTLSYHKAGGTSDCEFSVFDSIEPLDNFPSMKINSYTYPNSFIKILSDNSYHTAAFHGNISNYFSRNNAYPKIGFKDFHDMTRMGLKDVGWGAPDLDVFEYTAKQLQNQSSPFLYYLITMTSHGPFTNARNYYNNIAYNDITDTVVRDYFNSMSYVDKSLEFFINYIKQTLKNTYVIIIGDHTPSISNNLLKQSSFQMNNYYFEFVPMMIITPEGEVRQEKHISASFLDLAPTILNSSGISFTYKSNGLNLLGNEPGSPIPYRGKNYDRALLFNKISSSFEVATLPPGISTTVEIF